MRRRLLYGSGAAGALAAAYLLGSLTLGAALAAGPTRTSSPPALSAETGQVGSSTPEASSEADTPETPDQQTGSTSSAQPQADQPEPTDQAEAAALQSQAKITADQAKAGALAQFPGATVTAVALEDENGVPVYGVHLTDTSGKAQDVKVDAVSGKVLKAESDGPEGSGNGGDTSGSEVAGNQD